VGVGVGDGTELGVDDGAEVGVGVGDEGDGLADEGDGLADEGDGLADDTTADGGDEVGRSGALVPPIARLPRATTDARAIAAAMRSTATDATIGSEARGPRLVAGTFGAGIGARTASSASVCPAASSGARAAGASGTSGSRPRSATRPPTL
jgi:hypothetical protein